MKFVSLTVNGSWLIEISSLSFYNLDVHSNTGALAPTKLISQPSQLDPSLQDFIRLKPPDGYRDQLIHS